MKSLFAALLVLVSAPAFADTFSCTLEVGYFEKETIEAPYQGREASITLRPFKCDGSLLSDGSVAVRISSTEVEQQEYSSGKGLVSVTMTGLDTFGDGLETGVCTCGLN